MRELTVFLAKTWKISFVGCSARHSRLSPSGAAWSFVLQYPTTHKKPLFVLSEPKNSPEKETASVGTTWQYNERHVVN